MGRWEDTMVHLYVIMKRLWRYLLRGIFRRSPVKWMCSEEYVRRYCRRWYLAYQKSTVQRRPAVSLGATRVDFSDRFASEFPDLGVLEIYDGYVLCPQGWIFTKDNPELVAQLKKDRNGEPGA